MIPGGCDCGVDRRQLTKKTKTEPAPGIFMWCILWCTLLIVFFEAFSAQARATDVLYPSPHQACSLPMLRFRSHGGGKAKRQDRGRQRTDDRRDASESPGGRRGFKGRDSQRQRDSVSGGPRRISAVPARQLKARDWLRAYADHKGECVETFGKGATALSPLDMKKYLNTNNSEFKRRMGFALSFMCATFRSAWTVVKHLPSGLQELASTRKKRGCLLRALADLRVMLSTKKGKKFLRACDYFDSKHVCPRDKKDAEMHVRAWLDWIEETKGLTRVFMTLANCSSRLFLCATWGLESQACTSDLSAWAVGFPTDKNIMAALPRAVRAWLRKPASKKLLIKALSESAKEHVADAGAGKKDWADYDDDGDADDRADDASNSDNASAAQARDASSSSSAVEPSSPAKSSGDDPPDRSSSSSSSSDDGDDPVASDASPASSTASEHADRRASKKGKQKGRRQVSFAAAKKKLKKRLAKDPAARKQDKRAKPDKSDKPDKPDKPDKSDKPDKPDKPRKSDKPDRPDKPDKPDKRGKQRRDAGDAAPSAMSRVDATKDAAKRSRSCPPPRRQARDSLAADDDDAASQATVDLQSRATAASNHGSASDSDVNDDEALVPRRQASAAPKDGRSRLGRDAAPQESRVDGTTSRPASSRTRPADDVRSAHATQPVTARSGATKVSAVLAAPVDDRQRRRPPALVDRARSGTRAPPPVVDDVGCDHDPRDADDDQPADLDAPQKKRMRAAPSADGTRQLHQAPLQRPPAPSSPDATRALVPESCPDAPAAPARARSRSRAASKSRPRSLGRGAPPQATPRAPLVSASETDDDPPVPVYPTRPLDQTVTSDALRHRSQSAPPNRRGSRAAKPPQPEVVDAIKKKLIAAASRPASSAEPAAASSHQPPLLVDSEDESRQPAPPDPPLLGMPSWAPLADPPQPSDAEDAQPPPTAPDTQRPSWSLSAVLEAKALSDCAAHKIAADAFALDDFEALIQAIPSDVRAASGIGLKTSNRTRLPRNLHLITTRIAEVIRDELSAHGVEATVPSVPQPQPSSLALTLSQQSPPPGQPDTLLD